MKDELRIERERASVELKRWIGESVLYVLAPSRLVFMEFVRDRGLNLQRCKYLGRAEDMQGLDWSSPLKELIVINGELGARGEDYRDVRATTISRYCQQKRVHAVRRISL